MESNRSWIPDTVKKLRRIVLCSLNVFGAKDKFFDKSFRDKTRYLSTQDFYSL